jgi:hypothetical protein
MEDARVMGKAKVALAFREQPKQIYYHYVRTRWKKQVIATAAFAALIAAAWLINQPLVAIGVFGFWGGRLMRDYQWFSFLTGEWATTCPLIDWPKAEALAAEYDSSKIPN